MTRISPTRVAVLCLVAAAVLFAAAPAFAAAPNPTVYGTLYSSDGQVITDGQVVVNHQVKGVWKPMVTLSTAPNGTWTFTAKADTYQLSFSAPFADPASRTLTTVKGGSYPLDVTLQAYGSLTGTITDSDSGEALAGASVALYRANGDGTWALAQTVTSGTDGTYASGTVPTGTWAAKATASGHVDGFYGGGTSPETAGTIAINRGANATANVALAKIPVGPSSISGHVSRGLLQVPLGNAVVFVFKQAADGSWPTSFSPGSEYDMVFTNYLGDYVTEVPLELGNYKVRFFSYHGVFPAEWYDHVTTISEATTLTISAPGQSYTGIDAWVNRTQ